MVSEYTTPPYLPPEFAGMIDPNGGFLCLSMHWRPKLGDPNPDMPGEKLSMSSYIPLSPADSCLCGSGKLYRKCCRPKRDWRPVCPNSGRQGYSLVRPQQATFRDVGGPTLRERLMADARLRCVDQSFDNSFWILFGDPPVQDQYGFLCFGDFELEENRTLVVTAMSDLRMRVQLDLLREIASDCLGSPEMSRNPVPVIEKPTRRARMRSPRRRLGSKRRKR